MTAEARLSQLIDEVWRAHRGTNLARIDAIERAALSVLEGGIEAVARESAAMDAHKLTGVLGTLGWAEGSKLALEAESALRSDAPVDAKRLAEIAVALRAGSDARDAGRPDGATGHPTARTETPAAAAAAPDVLVVEDDPVLADLLSSALRYRGHRTDVMSDGETTLDRLTRPEARPRLVILDAYLPGLDGVSVLRSLAERGALEHMSVIMLTVRSGEDEVLASLRLGAVDHVAKPFSLAVLLEKADRLLAR